jgi:hypothetical protein
MDARPTLPPRLWTILEQVPGLRPTQRPRNPPTRFLPERLERTDMGDTQGHVYPDPDGATSTVPSSVPLDTASLAAGTASVGAALAGAVDAGIIPFLIPPSMAASASSTISLVVRPMSEGYVWAVIGFGALSVILGTINLIWGFRRKKKFQERMRPHQAALDALCETSNVFAD